MARPLQELPLSSVVKAATQDNPRIKLSKEAKAALVRSATVFLVYMATAGAERAQLAKRSTVNHEDVFQAIRDLGHEGIEEGITPAFEALTKELEAKREKRKAANLARAAAGGSKRQRKGTSEAKQTPKDTTQAEDGAAIPAAKD